MKLLLLILLAFSWHAFSDSSVNIYGARSGEFSSSSLSGTIQVQNSFHLNIGVGQTKNELDNGDEQKGQSFSLGVDFDIVSGLKLELSLLNAKESENIDSFDRELGLDLDFAQWFSLQRSLNISLYARSTRYEINGIFQGPNRNFSYFLETAQNSFVINIEGEILEKLYLGVGVEKYFYDDDQVVSDFSNVNFVPRGGVFTGYLDKTTSLNLGYYFLNNLLVSIIFETSHLVGVDEKRRTVGFSASYEFNDHWVIDLDSSKIEQEEDDQLISGLGLSYIF